MNYIFNRPDRDLPLDLPDETRCAEAIKNLQSAFERVRAGGGLDAIGLGGDVRADLASLLKGRSEPDPSDPTILFVVPLDLFHDLVISTELPNSDARLLAMIRERVKKGPAEAKRKADARRKEKLQWCDLTIRPDAIYLRNRVNGLEFEASVPALVHNPDLCQRGTAFTLPLYILAELFDRRLNVPEQIRWGKEHFKKQIILLRYNPAEGLLEIFYGTAHLQITVRPLAGPEPVLATLAADAERELVSSDILAEALECVMRVATSGVMLRAGQTYAGWPEGQVAFSNGLVGPEALAIRAETADRLQWVLKRMPAGATIRKDASHSYVEKGIATLAFQNAPSQGWGFDQIEARVHEGGTRMTLEAPELLSTLGIAPAIDTNMLRLSLINGAVPHLRAAATSMDRRGDPASGVTYVPVHNLSNPEPFVGKTIEIRTDVWTKLIGSPFEKKSLDLVIAENGKSAWLRHEHENRVVRALLAVTPGEAEPYEMDDRIAVGDYRVPALEIVDGAAIGELLVQASMSPRPVRDVDAIDPPETTLDYQCAGPIGSALPEGDLGEMALDEGWCELVAVDLETALNWRPPSLDRSPAEVTIEAAGMLALAIIEPEVDQSGDQLEPEPEAAAEPREAPAVTEAVLEAASPGLEIGALIELSPDEHDRVEQLGGGSIDDATLADGGPADQHDLC